VEQSEDREFEGLATAGHGLGSPGLRAVDDRWDIDATYRSDISSRVTRATAGRRTIYPIFSNSPYSVRGVHRERPGNTAADLSVLPPENS
jgi:hypothetical protein